MVLVILSKYTLILQLAKVVGVSWEHYEEGLPQHNGQLEWHAVHCDGRDSGH